MAVLGVDGWRGAWIGALLSGRSVTDGTSQCVGDGGTDSRGRPMRICW